MVDKVTYYKYKRFDSPLDLTNLENAAHQKLWIPGVYDFGDPYEGHFDLKPLTAEEIMSDPVHREYYLNFYRQNGSPNLTTQKLHDILRQSPTTQSVNTYFKNHGVICLTESATNIPMWDYYADYHQGYCLQLEMDFSVINQSLLGKGFNGDIDGLRRSILEGEEILSFKSKVTDGLSYVFTKVRYCEKPPTINLKKFIQTSNEYKRTKYLINNSIGVKFQEWQHEQEHRLIVNTNSRTAGIMDLKIYVPFLKITGIIMGMRISDKNRDIITNLCRKNSLELLQAKASEASYEISVNKVDYHHDSLKNVETEIPTS